MARNLNLVYKPNTVAFVITGSDITVAPTYDVLDAPEGDGMTPQISVVDGTNVQTGFDFNKTYILTISKSISDACADAANAGIDNVVFKENIESGSGTPYFIYSSCNLTYGESITTADGFANIPITIQAQGFTKEDIRSAESMSFLI